MPSWVQAPSLSRSPPFMSQSYLLHHHSQQLEYSTLFYLSFERFLCILAPHTAHQRVPVWLEMMRTNHLQFFCIKAFADKNSGIVYHDLTGLFLFMSYDGSVRFFRHYNYKSNSILVTPIVGLDNVSIYNTYKAIFELLSTKGFKLKIKCHG